MIGLKTKGMLANSLQQQLRYGAMVQTGSRGFAGGGPKRAPISPDETEYDLVLVGGPHSAALTKHIQQHDDAQKLKIAHVSRDMKWVQPQLYFNVLFKHANELKLMTDGTSSMIDKWSRVYSGVSVDKLDANKNTLSLSNGQQISYKALVLGTGFEHSASFVEGLDELDKADSKNNVHVHMLESKERVHRNFFTGYFTQGGDYLCYSPKAPYKGEGTDFYALFFESMLRQDKLTGGAAKGARIQYWTPNKEIFKFPYANEVALEECEKRGVEVMFGWELLKMRQEPSGRKVGTFKNVDSGEVIEHDFFGASINPPSKPSALFKAAGIADADGLVDVNKYTLQHKKFENIFALGDCMGGETTRTFTGAIQQNPVAKHNVLQYLHGKDTNAIYDGYQYMPVWMGTDYAAGFSHLHDFEPTSTNHSMSHYGLFGNLYANYMKQNQGSLAAGYCSNSKDHGPPHKHYPARYDALEHNEYLNARQIPAEDVLHPNAIAKQLEPAV